MTLSGLAAARRVLGMQLAGPTESSGSSLAAKGSHEASQDQCVQVGRTKDAWLRMGAGRGIPTPPQDCVYELLTAAGGAHTQPSIR